MASEKHKQLANFLKNVHLTLRNTTAAVGFDKAWRDHCSNKDVLITYAKYMQQLATTHWEQNSSNELSSAFSRIKWSAEFAYDYFVNKSFQKYSIKDIEIAKKMNITINLREHFTMPFKLLDVGSCYNPFKTYDFFNVLAIDLCPANSYVMECDFLNVSIGAETFIINNKVQQLEENSYDIVTFCFLLEYIPTSELRIKACDNAYRLLKFGGLLVINTPDSKHVGANSKIMKCWRHTLATNGFSRIKYEKLKHMHCIVFRKSLHKNIAGRWAILYRESYMDGSMHIPQDFSTKDVQSVKCSSVNNEAHDFVELPFNNLNFSLESAL